MQSRRSIRAKALHNASRSLASLASFKWDRDSPLPTSSESSRTSSVSPALYWEAVVALRKGCVAALPVLSSQIDTEMQVHLAMLLLMVALIAHLAVRPFTRRWARGDRGSRISPWAATPTARDASTT